MQVLVFSIIALLIIVIIVLGLKIYLMQKSAKEIEENFTDRLKTETNTLIDISSRDKYMLSLASTINDELKTLRDKRRKFNQGDLEVKEAITNISHDLRTPLTAIFGYLDLLENEEKTENVQRYINIIKNRADTLKQLTEELFKYSIATSTIDNKFYEEVILNNILEESISVYYGVLKEKNITPQICITDKKIKRFLDKNAVSRIFANIISNAIKYSEDDLKIVLNENGELVFSNTAKNLDNIQVERLFDRFYTVENANKSTGLGLSIAKMLTEEMSGSICAEYKNNILSIKVKF